MKGRQTPVRAYRIDVYDNMERMRDMDDMSDDLVVETHGLRKTSSPRARRSARCRGVDFTMTPGSSSR